MLQLLINEGYTWADIDHLGRNGSLDIFLKLIMLVFVKLQLNVQIVDFVLQNHELRIEYLLLRFF